MGKPTEAAVHAVGFLMLENLSLESQRLGDGGVLPESMIPDAYQPALYEFQDLYRTNEQTEFAPPDGFRQQCIDHITRYLEMRGYLV